MNSFDVFDTLLARRFITSVPLFNQMEAELKIPDFQQRRVAADNGSRTLAEIYQELDLPEDVMHREVELEFDNAVPIVQNLQRVQHGDLLISDMYMSASDILRMVRGVGLDKQVTIYQSNKGKSSGDVWRQLMAHKPFCHLGDNRHSDYELPRSLGFHCELYEGAGMTKNEAVLVEVGLPFLACLMREIRLSAASAEYAAFLSIAGQLNLPWLFFTSELLHRKHTKKLVFLGRDSQLLCELFNTYFAAAYYLPFSRQVAFTQPREAVAYLAAHSPQDSILVDVSSTGATWQKLQAGLPIEAVIYSDVHSYTESKPQLPDGFSFLTRNSQCGQTNYLLEIFNCGDHGYLERIDILSGGLMGAEFSPLQLDPDLIAAIHRPVHLAKRLAGVYRARIRAELSRASTQQLLELFGAFAQQICAQKQLNPELHSYFQSERAYKTMLQRETQAPGLGAKEEREAHPYENAR